MASRGLRISFAVLWALLCTGLVSCQQQPSPDRGTVHFTASGDIGMGDGARSVLDVVSRLDPDFNIALGDLSYKAGAEKDFCRMVNRKLGAEFPFELITGNHESDGHDGLIDTFAGCLPNRLPGLHGTYGVQWYVDVPQEQPLARIILISPGLKFQDGNELDYSRGSDRWKWTKAAVVGARDAGIPWTLVAMHAPCFSLGKYDCVAGPDITNLLVGERVDLVLTAHEHVYQRTHQLVLGGGCPWIEPGSTQESCLAGARDQLLQGDGTIFAGVGTGGLGGHQVNAGDPEAGYFASWSGANKDPALGTLDVQVTGDRLDARFVPAAGYSFTDRFIIARQ
ncbi:metallophosphoesterase [Pseudarthrobacter sp. C4D7]|uniref:metallophosphoesterase n=1 Tax=Pseudarthrobacter sp. C4D7 TaxID=2735268 RepID=UPI0015858944|nr:metallophosphoesterase [Pseudarthrobacter sp. C4D7]NUT70587.1 phosphohydrolase [Pseudarthrobacter sp. C4D7]